MHGREAILTMASGWSSCTISPCFVLSVQLCLSAATDMCIARLIEEELLPLQHSIANGSSLLNYADQHFVSVF